MRKLGLGEPSVATVLVQSQWWLLTSSWAMKLLAYADKKENRLLVGSCYVTQRAHSRHSVMTERGGMGGTLRREVTQDGGITQTDSWCTAAN